MADFDDFSGFTTVSKKKKKSKVKNPEKNLEDSDLDAEELDIDEPNLDSVGKYCDAKDINRVGDASELTKNPEDSGDCSDSNTIEPNTYETSDLDEKSSSRTDSEPKKSNSDESDEADMSDSRSTNSHSNKEYCDANDVVAIKNPFDIPEENEEYSDTDTIEPPKNQTECMGDIEDDPFNTKDDAPNYKTGKQLKKEAKKNKKDAKRDAIKNKNALASDDETKELSDDEGQKPTQSQFMKCNSDDCSDTNDSKPVNKKDLKQAKKDAKQNKKSAKVSKKEARKNKKSQKCAKGFDDNSDSNEGSDTEDFKCSKTQYQMAELDNESDQCSDTDESKPTNKTEPKISKKDAKKNKRDAKRNNKNAQIGKNRFDCGEDFDEDQDIAKEVEDVKPIKNRFQMMEGHEDESDECDSDTNDSKFNKKSFAILEDPDECNESAEEEVLTPTTSRFHSAMNESDNSCSDSDKEAFFQASSKKKKGNKAKKNNFQTDDVAKDDKNSGNKKNAGKKGSNNGKGNKNSAKNKKNNKSDNRYTIPSRYPITPNLDGNINKDNQSDKDSDVNEDISDKLDLEETSEMATRLAGATEKKSPQNSPTKSLTEPFLGGETIEENYINLTPKQSPTKIVCDPFPNEGNNSAGVTSNNSSRKACIGPFLGCDESEDGESFIAVSCIKDKIPNPAATDVDRDDKVVYPSGMDSTASYPSFRDCEADGESTYTSCLDADTDCGTSYPSSMEADVDMKTSYPNCPDDADGAPPSSDELYPLAEIGSSAVSNVIVPDCAKIAKRMPNNPKPKHGIRIRLNLVRSARKYMSLLKNIDSLDLYDGSRVAAAIFRYEMMWLPLLSRNDSNTLIAPPIDVHWVWIVHMLAPQQYTNDCEILVGKLLPHRLLSGSALLRGEQVGQGLWEESYPDEPWNLRDEDIGSPRYIHLSSLSYDLVKAVNRQSSFYYQVCLPHYECKTFLRKAEVRYRQFIKLKKLYPDEFLVPTYDIDLMWHTHQIHPFIYRDDCFHLLGSLFPHDDSVNDREEGSKLRSCDQRTRELWCKTYGTTLRQEASMYRGDSPQTYLDHTPGLIENSARSVNFFVKIVKIKIKGKLKKGQLRLRIKQEEPLSCSTIDLVEFTMFHCGSKEADHFVADRDITFKVPQVMCCNYIVLKVTYKQRLQKLADFFQQESFWSMSNFKDLFNGDVSGEVIKKFKDDKTRVCIELTLHVTKKLSYTWVPMGIFTGKFLPVCLDPEEVCSLYGVTAVHHDSYHENSFTADRAIHRLYDDSSPKRPELFEVWVTHSFQFMLSSIQIFAITDQKELVPVCIAHTLDHNTLASPRFLKKDAIGNICPPHMDLKEGQRGIIIKTAKGDYAIIVGWWEGRKQGVKPSFIKKGVKGDPGNLVIRVWHPTSSKEPYTLALPYERRKFTLLVNNLSIDLKNGRIKVSDDTEDFIEHLALGLAISTLHVLVEPRSYVGGDEPDSKKTDKTKPRRIPSESLPLLAALGFACAAAPTNSALMRRVDRENQPSARGPGLVSFYPLLGNNAGCGSCGGCGGCGGGVNDSGGPIGWDAAGVSSGHTGFDSGAGGEAAGGGGSEIGFMSYLFAATGEDGMGGGDGGGGGCDAGDGGGCGGGCGGCGG